MGANNIDEVIRHYIDRKDTRYSILISAPWGAGKTYYWENELKKFIEKEKKYKTLYVSLNGLDTKDQIARKIVTTYWKDKTGGMINAEGLEKNKEMLRGFSKFIGKKIKSCLPFIDSFVKIDLKPENMLDYIDFNEILICFDDLERYSDIKQALGFINDFVEHKKAKAIILANEDKIEGEFSEVKEKVVGKTIKFALDNKKILESIIQSYDEEVRAFYLEEINLIVEMMDCNRSCNYRVIRTILDDFSDVYNYKNQFDHESFLKAKTLLFKYSLAVGLEIRVSGIDKNKKELIKEVNLGKCMATKYVERTNNDAKSDSYDILFVERYYKRDFEGRFLFRTIFEYIDSGNLDIGKLKEEILRYKDETPVDYLCNIGYWKMTNDAFEVKIKTELLGDIENGNIDLAIYPRLFTFYGYFQESGLIKDSLNDLEKKFISGIDKIKEKNVFKKRYIADTVPYSKNYSEEVKKIHNNIKKSVEEAGLIVNENYDEGRQKEFLKLLRKDVAQAVDLINDQGNIGIEYRRIPIFEGVDEDEIYEILKTETNPVISKFEYMLLVRCGTPEKDEKLEKEYTFIQDLSKHILEKLEGKDNMLLSDHLLMQMAKKIIDFDRQYKRQ